ncbi:hypothetical protein QZM62_14705 [Burkholderia multivorans]|nr:hypothetical protein [Burkholderia multivorans]
MAITNEQLADLLMGIARSQKAVVDAVAQHLGQQGGQAFRLGAVIPALQAAAGIANRGQPTLHDLPSRILLQIQSPPPAGAPRIEEWLAQELNRLAP